MWHETLIRKLKQHSNLSDSDVSSINTLPGKSRQLKKNEDILRQGDKPQESAVILEGMVARYHNAPGGRRQYLSFHLPGDMPDAQTLFLETMDFALCAIEKASVVLVPHAAILKLFITNPNVGFAIWKETLIDAAIFREAITNNSSRELEMRIAHFFCEHFYRSKKIGLVKNNSCSLPLSQTQLSETLACSLPSVSRALIKLRKTGTVQFRNGILTISDWDVLSRIADFNADYLHLHSKKS